MKNKKILITIIGIIALMCIAKCSEAKELTKNCLLYPIANTDVSMYVEYGKGTRNYYSKDSQGNTPNCCQFFTNKTGIWYEIKNAGLSTSENHFGVDITAKDYKKVKSNTYDVISVASGTVIATSANRDGGTGSLKYIDNNERQEKNYKQGGGYGNYVIVRLDGYTYQGNYVYVQYSHLYSGSVKVTKGSKVSAGTVIGKMGSSGDSGHPHLHFEVMYGAKDSTIVYSFNYHLASGRKFLNPTNYIKSQVLKKSEDKKTKETLVTIKPGSKNIVGDVNGDNVVDIKDAQIVLKYYTQLAAGYKNPLTAAQKKVADYNKDNVVNMKDAVAILQYSAKQSAAKKTNS